jgi:hypothetical protein
MNVHPDADAKRRATIAALRSRQPEWMPSHVYWRMTPAARRHWFLSAIGVRA